MSTHLRTKPLKEIAALNPPAQSAPGDTIVSFVKMSAVSSDLASVVDEQERRYIDVSKGYVAFSRGDLLVAKITPCFENVKIAQATIKRPLGFGSTEFHVVRPKAGEVDTRYLLHFLRQERIRVEGARKMTGSAGQRRVPAHFLADLEIPVPAMSKQQMIAELLDRADALRAKRRAAMSQLDALIEATFLDPFQRPEAARWPELPISSLAAQRPNSIRTGPFGSQLLHSEFVESGVAVLGIDNAVQNEFVWARPRFITDNKYRQLQRYSVFPGDVLITIMGTCGRCAIVPDEMPPAINTKHLCCISLDEARCLPM